MSMLYIAVDALSKDLTEEYLQYLEGQIREMDKVEDFLLVDFSCSDDLAGMMEPMDMNDPGNWGRLKIIMIPEQGEIMGFYPRRLLEDFKRLSSPERSSYDLFRELLEEE